MVVQKRQSPRCANGRSICPLLLRGAVTTVEISILAMALAVVLGLVVVLVRLYGIPPLRWLAQAYVEVIRGTPLLIQLFLIYYGLPEIGIRLNRLSAPASSAWA